MADDKTPSGRSQSAPRLQNIPVRTELVELSERLDGELGDPLLDKLDEHLAKVRPELFVDPNEGVVTKEEV